jgi:hypothetical protein
MKGCIPFLVPLILVCITRRRQVIGKRGFFLQYLPGTHISTYDSWITDYFSLPFVIDLGSVMNIEARA